MGIFDFVNKKLASIPNDPIKMGLLAYGMTGQGRDPGGTAINAALSTAAANKKAEEEARIKAQQQMLQQSIIAGFGKGAANPALLAQYAAMGGEGAGNLIDMQKFYGTPQSIAPGSMYRDPNSGAITMPAPKMSDGQMWDGRQVVNAPGFLQAYGDQKAVDARTEVDKYAAQQGIGYQYDLGRMGAQNTFDLNKMGVQNAYDLNKMGAQNDYQMGQMQYQSDLGRGDFAYQQGVKDSGDYMQVYNPNTGNVDYVSKANMRGMEASGFSPIASQSETAKTVKLEQAKYDESKRQAVVAAGDTAAKQMARLNQLDALAKKGLDVGGLAPVYQQVGSVAADLGIKVDGLSELQQAQKVILQLAQDIPLPPGAASNIDVQQRLQQLPNISDSPAAFASSVQAMRDLADMNLTVSDYVQKYGYTPEVQSQINDLYANWGKAN